MRFDSEELIHADSCSYGNVRATIGEVGNGNSEETILEFEVPSGFAQPMEVTLLTGSMPDDQEVYTLQEVHTVRIKITGQWEGGEILQGLAELIHNLKLRSILLS